MFIKAFGQASVALRARGRTVEALERLDAALAHAAVAHSALAERGWTLAQAGFCLADLGLPAQAATLLDQAVSLLPQGIDLAVTRVHRLVQGLDAGRVQRDEVEAELGLLAPIMGDPAHPRRLAQLLFVQGWAKQSAGLHGQAMDLLQEAASLTRAGGGAEVCQWALLRVSLILDPKAALSDEALGSLGVAYKTVLARVHRDRELKSLDPREPRGGELAAALFLLAELFARQGRPVDALRLVTRALALKESVWTALSELMPSLKSELGPVLRPVLSPVLGALEPWWLRGAQDLQARMQARAQDPGPDDLDAAWAALRHDLEL
jgi:tetratricopeptide (TPR) repeat protein